EGVNDRVQLAALGAELNRRIVQRWQRAGVTIVDPATTWLDADVELGQDVVIEPNVQLKAGTTVGAGAIIGPDTTLSRVEVGTGAGVVRTHGSASVIGAGASVGAFTSLGPGTRLGITGRLGALVEANNAETGAGPKVRPLTYVGDATTGEYSNIGCG